MAEKKDMAQEIREALGDQLHYDMDKMFPDREGYFDRQKVKAKLKLLKNLMPALSTALFDGEKLLYVAKGYIAYWWEQLFAGGAVSYYANITAVVLTEMRILFINTNGSGKQKHFRNQVLYSEIASVKMKSFLSSAATMKFKDGRSLSIGGFKGKDRKRMQEYIPDLIAHMPKEAPRVSRSIQYLCPHCRAAYTSLVRVCEKCGTVFKSPKKAAVLSLFLPGLGDMYLGHHLFGFFELLGSLFEWFVLFAAIVGAIEGGPGSGEFLVLWIGIMAVTSLIDFFLTRAMGSKGLIPASHAPAHA